VIGDILQPTHLLFILVVALLVLGPKRLPEVGRSLGRGLRDFKDAISGEERERHDEVPSYTPEPSEPVPYGPASYPSPPVATEPVIPPSGDTAAPSPPADGELVSHPSGEPATAVNDPADAELVSDPSGESTAKPSEPAGLVR
jgi:sec-independent protein translocase protein TatA